MKRTVSGSLILSTLRATLHASIPGNWNRARPYIKNSLIDGLLDVGRVSRDEMTMTAVDFSVEAEAILDEFKLSNPARKVTTTVQPGMRATADAHLMQSVLLNLLGNAWKYTVRTDDAQIEFGVLSNVTPRTFYIRDNGMGFEMQYAQKLFVPFQRLHADETIEGMGIGLATVKRIIERHLGRIWFEAKIGRGATFFFTLGRLPDEEPQ